MRIESAELSGQADLCTKDMGALLHTRYPMVDCDGICLGVMDSDVDWEFYP